MRKAKRLGKKRMVYACLSNSDKWNDLATDQARLLYILLLIHTDDMGRMDAAPRTVKGICTPSLDWTAEQIGAYLDDLARVGLIKPYGAGGKKYLEITDFDDYQTFRHERMAQYPDPEPNYTAVKCAKNENLEQLTPAESNYTAAKCAKNENLERKDKIREDKIREDKGSKQKTTESIPPHLSEVWKAFVELRKAKKKPLTDRATKNILKILSPYPQEDQIAMIDQSITNGWTGIFPLKTNKNDNVNMRKL